MSIVAAILSAVCLGAGSFFCVVGAVGLLRMPDLYTRMHAASVTETLGATLVLLGLALHAGPTLASAKLAMIGVLVLLTGPASTHALAKAALARGVKPMTEPRERTRSKP